MDFVDNNIQKVQVQPKDQVYARNEDIKVYGKLVSMSTENVVADSEQIWDKGLKKNQSDINSVTQSKFGEYLPLTGGDINGNLNVVGTIGINGTLTLGDSLHIEENNFDFEGADNESLTINSNGLTYAFTENQNQGFNVADGDAKLNSLSVISKNDEEKYISHIRPGGLTINDGDNTARFTSTSVELQGGNETHITANKIITDKILMQNNGPSRSNRLSITPNSIIMDQGGSKRHQTMITPSGITTDGYISLKNGTDQDILLANGDVIKLSQPNGVAKLDQDGNIPLENLGNLDTQIALVVNQLPTIDIKTNKIYLVRKNETGEDNAYIEYVYINGSWEKLGEYTPSIDLSEYSLKRQTVSSAAFVNSNNNMSLQLTNADNSKNTIQVPLAQPPIVSAGHLTSGQNGFMSVSDKVKLDSIQADFSNCVKTDENSTINADVTVNGKISSTDANIVINSGKLELHEGSYGINFISGKDSSYISKTNGKSNEYFATDGSIQTIPNSYLPLSGGTVTGGITVDGAINTKSNITTDGTVTAKGFVSKTEKNPHEVWACNGGSINLKTLIAATAVYVHGSIVESIAGSINSTVTIEDPDAIIFNKATGSFVAKKGNGYYRYWSVIDNLLISDSDKYGFLTTARGIVPYHKQLYIFDNDNVNIYIANNTGSVSILDVYIN